MKKKKRKTTRLCFCLFACFCFKIYDIIRSESQNLRLNVFIKFCLLKTESLEDNKTKPAPVTSCGLQKRLI